MGSDRDTLVAESHRDEHMQILKDITRGEDVAIVTAKDEPKTLSDPDGVYETWDLC